jgi:hypothetical protein
MLRSFKEQSMKYYFDTLLEETVVSVTWEYETDEDGIYNSEVTQVMYQGIDVLPVLSEAAVYELDAAAYTAITEEKAHE